MNNTDNFIDMLAKVQNENANMLTSIDKIKEYKMTPGVWPEDMPAEFQIFSLYLDEVAERLYCFSAEVNTLLKNAETEIDDHK